MLLARLPAMLLEYRALPAMLEAWLNLSQREKARLFVMVKTMAMAIISHTTVSFHLLPFSVFLFADENGCFGAQLTDEGQPHKLEAHQGQDGEGDPENGLGVDGEPEEAAVGGVDDSGVGVAALEDPAAVARGRVDLVPPAQPDQPPSGDVLEVVEVGR